MRNKKLTYFLIFIVLVLWGMILYRIFAAVGNDDDAIPPVTVDIKKEAYNDFEIPKDTAHLLLNYRDPFGIIKFKDTVAVPVKGIHYRAAAPVPAKSAVNWAFIQYSGYIRNPGSKKLIAFVTINGKNETFSEGDTKDQVKLIKNLRDSIKVSFNGQIKFIPIKSATL